MASSTTQEQTFLNFTPEQAAVYAKHRGSSYPPALYRAILDFHKGPRDLVYDVGAGPGKVVFDMLHHFSHGVGSDTGEQMIAQATKDAAAQGYASRARFQVASGEDCCAALLPDQIGKVDLLTVAMAAHWFRMDEFYRSAARALKPGTGTLAIWTLSSFYAHPSDPLHKELQAVLSDFEDNVLGPYMASGNHLSRNGYRTLAMPWDDQSNVPFDRESFQRRDWDTNGVPSAPDLEDGSKGPFQDMSETDIDLWEIGMGSSSPVARWRQANPDKVHTDEDVVRVVVGKLRNVLGNRKTFFAGSSCSLLLFRRSA